MVLYTPVARSQVSHWTVYTSDKKLGNLPWEVRDQEIINIKGLDYAGLYTVQIKSLGLCWFYPRDPCKPNREKAAS